jgi:hypothetical protein
MAGSENPRLITSQRTPPEGAPFIHFREVTNISIECWLFRLLINLDQVNTNPPSGLDRERLQRRKTKGRSIGQELVQSLNLPGGTKR